MKLFFSHETLSYPPSLSKNGKMRSGEKAELAKCLETMVPNEQTSENIEVTAAVFEGSVLANLAKPKKNQTFEGYCIDMILPQIKKGVKEYSLKRIDIIFDPYPAISLKSTTREKRSKGSRRKVTKSPIEPTNWREFLRVDQNKTELFRFLSDEIICSETEHTVCVAYDDSCKSNRLFPSIDDLTGCNHEEADTRIFTHVANLVSNGRTKLVIKTVDTDVMVLAIAAFARLQSNGLHQMWLEFGTGKHKRLIAIHIIYAQLGTDKALAMPFFHALTGCDQVSFFSGVTKSSAWKVWNVYSEITRTF